MIGLFFFILAYHQINGTKTDKSDPIPTDIRKTYPCYEYPLKPHFYIEKLGFAGVFLFLLQNIDCGYSLENIKIFPLKIIIFTTKNFFCILHGRVFVMNNIKWH